MSISHAFTSEGHIGNQPEEYLQPVASTTGANSDGKPILKTAPGSSYSSPTDAEKGITEISTCGHLANDELAVSKAKPFMLAGVAVVILGWWISSTVSKATRHRWYRGQRTAEGLMLTVSFQDYTNILCLVLSHVSNKKF
jgi:hypothetical protein